MSKCKEVGVKTFLEWIEYTDEGLADTHIMQLMSKGNFARKVDQKVFVKNHQYAVKTYFDLIKKGVEHSVAIHRAAGMVRHVSDKTLIDMIKKMRKR